MTKKDYNPSKAHQDAMKKPNPIEEAIGSRAKKSPQVKKPIKEITKAEELTNLIPQVPEQIPDEPSPSEMLTLENLNRSAEARLQDPYPEEPSPAVKTKILETQIPYVPPKTKVSYDPRPQRATIATPQETTTVTHTVPKVPIIPVSKPDPQPATKTSSLESPPQKIEKEFSEKAFQAPIVNSPAEDIELTALRKYILEDGFVLATVAFHIVSLCAEPLTTPSTTTWDFKDRAMIPDMVLALLNQPGYIEGIWPSLKIVMGSNKGNVAWSAGIATTIAFFDVIRTLPTIVELKNEVEKKP